ncbi:restriction endonuclease [Paenibacillus sp. WLX1005]|uniref:restriction endonuclease n=1 Tax=Paenibacillus sp. WLX1005 TaxID=3243766 RepID=UPI00398438DF
MISVLIIVAILIVGTVVYLIVKGSKTKHKAKDIRSIAESHDLKKITIEHIDQMKDGSEFEIYLYRLFVKLGYAGVYKTVGSRDFGADVVFTDREGIRNVIQAKRYSPENKVGIGAVQEAFSCMRYYKAKKSMVITTSTFTDSCETLAGINHVKLLDRDDLIAIIKCLQKDDIAAIKNRIEAEPRMILESWNEMNRSELHEIKKDHKAEELLQKMKSS